MSQKDKDIQEIQNFLNSNEIPFNKVGNCFELIFKDASHRGYEIEYVVSLDNPIAYPDMGIEGVSANYYYEKSIKAEENNSFKLWIKDFEWADDRKRDVLKSYILHAYGKTPMKFYARECEVKEVNSKDGSKFESEHCFYGKRGASLRLGLYTKKEKYGIPSGTLIMLYTFGGNFFGKKKGIIEVIRVGTLKFAHVSGGSSKLLKHFINNYKSIKIGTDDIEYSQLKFYSDYDHNIGNSMDSLGFEFDSYSKGGFMNWWVESGEIKHRQPMKHKWVMEQMKDGKVFAIPNAGTKTYIYNVV